MTTIQAAKILKLTPRRVRQLIVAGDIKADFIGRDWHVSESEVNRIEKLRAKTSR